MQFARNTSCAAAAIALAAIASPRIPARPELVEVRKIWDQAPHNAFTDLIRFKGRWYCAFREGQAHVSPDGAIRVLTSSDGADWVSAALLTSPLGDLRDPKLCSTPDDRLMLTTAAARRGAAETRHQSLVWFSYDGRSWADPAPVGEPDVWLWRVSWHAGRAYGIGYGTTDRRFIRLYTSRGGADFETLADNLVAEGDPNESSILFLEDDSALCLLRRDGKPVTALLGRSRPPYRAWTWKDLGARIGGPHMIRLPDGRIVAAGRLYDGKVRTALCWLDADNGALEEFLTLPSGGDTSYPGLVFHDGLLWVSYYSSHGGRTSIYLAKVKLREPTAASPPPRW